MLIETDSIFDFTSLPAGTEWDGAKSQPCPVCGKLAIPSRRRNERTYIHKGQLIKGVLNVSAFCSQKSAAPRWALTP